MKRSARECLVMWIAVALLVSAQDKAPSHPQNDYPVYTVDFVPAATIKPVTASRYFSPPILCSPNGTAYFGIPEPPLVGDSEAPSFLDLKIYSLNATEQRAFSYRELPGLYEARFRGFFPGESGTYVLVNATKDAPPLPGTAASNQTEPSSTRFNHLGERFDFLLRFDNSGSLQRAIQLPDALRFYRFAELEDGSFVAIAIDPSSASLRLPLLTRDGEIIRYLPLPSALTIGSNVQKDNIKDRRTLLRTQARLIPWFFAPVRHKILLYATDAPAPVLEIGPGGATREVQVALPEGFAVDGFVSSNDRWLVRFAREMIAEPGQHVVRLSARGDYLLYEVNFNDGSLVRELSLASIPNFGVACEHGGVLTGYSVGKDSKFIQFTANLP